MDFGFALPGRGPLATPDVLVKLACKADDLRYSSIFVTDHVVIPTTQTTPYPYAPTGKFAGDWTNGYLEPLTLMSFLAGETPTARVGEGNGKSTGGRKGTRPDTIRGRHLMH